MREYLVIFEPGENNWSAFSPDVPGCVATGRDRQETESNYQEALIAHLELLAEDGDEIPEPTGITAGYVTVPDFAPAVVNESDLNMTRIEITEIPVSDRKGSMVL